MVLRIDLEDWEGHKRYAEYDLFQVGDEKEKFAIKLLGSFTGTAGQYEYVHGVVFVRYVKLNTRHLENRHGVIFLPWAVRFG